MNTRAVILIFSFLIGLFLNLWIDGKMHEFISIFLFIFYFFSFIDSIGKSINFLQIPILFSLLQLLIMPIIVYRVYNDDYETIAFFYNMGTREEAYFDFILPAVVLMIIGMELPLIRRQFEIKRYFASFENTKAYLIGKSNIGIIMMIVGLTTGILEPFVGASFRYILYLFSKLLFVGIFYVVFSEIKNKRLYLLSGIGALLFTTIIQGMFGELIYTVLLGMQLILLGRKTAFWKKLSIAIVGGLLVLVLQTIKGDYRAKVWGGKGNQEISNTEAFFQLIYERISNPSYFTDKKRNLPIVVRFNQGMIQSKVMEYVPANRPYAEGETIINSILASFVPRFLWPDKPVAGGHWNMEYFTGLIIEGYSMNIGPFGESYGNFGPTGGVVFMFFYGLFFNLAIYLLLRYVKNRPTIILWFPILFLNSIQIETDILMTVNSLIKNCLFLAFCYWAADRFMRLKL